ncbi:MAG: hypothetical protein C4521_07535 [Actinobacteria bacterium]|nr:MAG: hypothetical protein C4521_07535 [Actinomycetota bacterium]
MGSIVIGSIVDRARRTLLELKVGQTSGVDAGWDRTLELLPLANAAIRAICAAIPSAYAKNESFQLASGSKQTLPAGGTLLLSVPHNLGADGATPGRAVEFMERMAIACIDPNWPSTTGTAVEAIIYDPRDPKVFWAYPRPTGTWYVQLVYAADPPDVAAGNIDSATIAVDDKYDTPIHDYIVGYAVLKNFLPGEYPKAAFFLQRFEQATGITLQRTTAFAPLDQAAAVQVPDALGKP